MYDVTLFLHVAAGAVGLLSLALPMLAAKGGRLHRRAGWVFATAMALVAVTGVLIAGSWIVMPTVVKDIPNTASAVAQMRTFGLFFLLLSVMAAHATAAGVVAIRARRTAMPRAQRLVRTLGVMVPVVSTVVLVAGVLAGSALLIGFGAIGLAVGVSELRTASSPRPNAWLIAHVDAMLGAATVALTAFTVQIVGRVGGDSLALWAWAIPVVVGNVTAALWKRSILMKRP